MEGAEAVVRRLYAALAARDGEAMAACYRPDAQFTDPVFADLKGSEVGDMWRMLCSRAKDLDVTVEEVTAEGPSVSSVVECRYTFTATGRPVRNRITSAFVVRDGRIALQHDDFDFPGWAAQAFGWKGRLLGRTRALRRQVQKTARKGLDRFRDAKDWADGKAKT